MGYWLCIGETLSKISIKHKLKLIYFTTRERLAFIFTSTRVLLYFNSHTQFACVTSKDEIMLWAISYLFPWEFQTFIICQKLLTYSSKPDILTYPNLTFDTVLEITFPAVITFTKFVFAFFCLIFLIALIFFTRFLYYLLLYILKLIKKGQNLANSILGLLVL